MSVHVAFTLDGLSARADATAGSEEDIASCDRENVLDVVPRVARIANGAAEVVARED